MTKVFIVGGDALIERMFLRRDDAKYEIVDDASKAGLIVFTGGHDVTPAFYGDKKHPTTSNSEERDERESKIYRKFENTPKVGICRGAQFLNVMSGGSLWQDVDNHALGRTHKLAYAPKGGYRRQDPDAQLVLDFEVHDVTSTHHQMMMPSPHGSIWAWCQRSSYRDTGTDMRKPSAFGFLPDIEIVNYEDEYALCFQAHPEYGVKSCEDLFFRCLERAYG